MEALSERLRVTGFRIGGDHDEAVWKTWRLNRMDDAAAQAHTDALVYGRSFVIVWAGRNGPVITVESPLQVAVLTDRRLVKSRPP